MQFEALGLAPLVRPNPAYKPGQAPLNGRTRAPAAPFTFLSSRRPLPPALLCFSLNYSLRFTFAAMGAPPGPQQGIEQGAGWSTRARSRLGNRAAAASASRIARRPRRSRRRRGDGVGRDQGGRAAAGELHELHHLHTSPSSSPSSQARGYAASWIGLVFVVWCHRAHARGCIG